MLLLGNCMLTGSVQNKEATTVQTDRQTVQKTATNFGVLLNAISQKKSASKNEQIYSAVSESAQKYNLPPALIMGVIKQESGFNPNAVSHCGAQGCMQLMPGTARMMGVTDPFDIRQNIDGGSKYLRQMLDHFKGDLKLAIAAYNCGPGNVEKAGGRIPNIPETQNYVPSVLAHYEKFSGQPWVDQNAINTMCAVVETATINHALTGMAAVSASIASNVPSALKQPEFFKKDETPPPPPPPPTAMRV